MRVDDEDGALAGIDLEAWQPPAPASGLADAVIARLREPAAVPALEAQPPRRAGRTRIALVAGALAVAAAGAALALWGTERAPRDGHGARIASGAEHLALDATTADLDPGAALRWTRHGSRITAHQARGTVHWTVADDDSLVLESGGDDSAVSIVASGASLRVEVAMNLSDARILGVTTATAALTALVTVAVYHGHITATSGGQTIQIEPGATVELRSASPPRAPVAVGAASDHQDQTLRQQLAAADKRVAKRVADAQMAATPRPKFCETMNVEDLVQQATNQYMAGYSRPALALMRKVLGCEQNPRTLRLAGVYACGARDGKTASELWAKLSARDGAAIVQRCQIEGITLVPPR